jgi:two-component SAPR family response regulator
MGGVCDMQNAKVLIIEDDDGIALDLEWIVRDMRLNLMGIARTRNEAVALAKEELPDLILSDVDLSDGSTGVDAVRDIIGEIDARVIFVTASANLLEDNLNVASHRIIPKPYREITLRNAINDALSMK